MVWHTGAADGQEAVDEPFVHASCCLSCLVIANGNIIAYYLAFAASSISHFHLLVSA